MTDEHIMALGRLLVDGMEDIAKAEKDFPDDVVAAEWETEFELAADPAGEWVVTVRRPRK